MDGCSAVGFIVVVDHLLSGAHQAERAEIGRAVKYFFVFAQYCDTLE